MAGATPKRGLLVPAAIVAAGLFVVLAILVAGAAGIHEDPADEAMQETARSQLLLDTQNTRLMHFYGMPTKADVMEWHMTGQWGWCDGSGENARWYVFDTLPGYTTTWDDLYGIDPDNPAFDK